MRGMMSGLILGVAALVVWTQWPDIQRYIKMRAMARDQNPPR